MNHKAAMEMKYLVSLILIAVVIILMIAIVYNISKTTQRASYKQQCKASVEARARLVSMPAGTKLTGDKASIECPTQYVTITEKSDVKKKEKFANLIADCWSNFGQGKLVLFDVQDLRFCAICSVVQFKQQGRPLEGLAGHMATTKVPPGIDPASRSYQEFLTGQKTTTQDGTSGSSRASAIDKIDTTKRHMIVYTFFKESTVHQIFREHPTAAGVTYGVTYGLMAQAVIPIPGAGFLVGFFVGSSVKDAASELQGPTATSQAVATTQGTSTAGYNANVMVFEYSPAGLAQLGCGELPVGQLEKRFR